MFKMYKFVLLIILISQSPFSFATLKIDDFEKKVNGKKSSIIIGGRLQAILEQNSPSDTQDFYLRRARLNIEYRPMESHTFVYDIRNDDANSEDDGEGEFNIGDAYWQIDINKNTINNVRLFRAKADVSYSQTSSSKNLFNPQRPNISDYASNFVIHNRRAVNAQINGSVGDLSYHVVLSDGVHSEELTTLKGSGVNKVNHQKLTYGGKLRYYFFGDAKKNQVQDTFYGKANSFSFGIGYFANDKINVDNSNNNGGLQSFSFNRKLTNIELSYSYYELRILAEFFDFSGDFSDLSAGTIDEVLSKSNGHYTQLEYLFGRWAPYVIYEKFNKNREIASAYLESITFGVNFYWLNESRRFGISYKNENYGSYLSNDDSSSVQAYAMLDF